MSLEPVARWKDKVTIVQGLSGRVCGGGLESRSTVVQNAARLDSQEK